MKGGKREEPGFKTAEHHLAAHMVSGVIHDRAESALAKLPCVTPKKDWHGLHKVLDALE